MQPKPGCLRLEAGFLAPRREPNEGDNTRLSVRYRSIRSSLVGDQRQSQTAKPSLQIVSRLDHFANRVIGFRLT